MFFQKLLIATISFAVPLTASTAVLADHQDWDRDDDWNNEDDWDDDHDWDDHDWDDDDWNDDDWDDDDDDGWHDDGHNKGVRLRDLEFNDKGNRLVLFGELENLKKHKKHKKPVKIHVKARGDVLALCIKPNGNIPAGKNPVDADEITVTGQTQLDLDDFDKGAIDFKVATGKPDMTIDGAPDCPNWKWTEKILDLAFTEVELIVVQDGKKVLELECFFDEPTDDGKVPRKQFDCDER